MDQLDSGIAVHSTDMQMNNQEYRMIHVHKFITKCIASNAETMEKFWSLLLLGAVGRWRQPEVLKGL